MLLFSHKDTLYSHIARRHEEPAIVHNRNHILRAAGLKDVPCHEDAVGIRCGRQVDNSTRLQLSSLVGADGTVLGLGQGDIVALRENGRNSNIAVRHGELIACHGDGVAGCIHNIPFHEEIARIRCCCQSDHIAHIGCRRGTDSTSFGWTGNNCDTMLCHRSEHSRVGGIARHRDLIAGAR